MPDQQPLEAIYPNELACPHCEKSFPVSTKAMFDSQYRFRMSIELLGDRLLAASDVGTAIRASGKLLQAISKQQGQIVDVAVASIDYNPRELVVEYIVAEVVDRPEGGES